MKLYQRKCIIVSTPVILGFLLFYVFPYGESLYLSLVKSTIQKDFVGFNNYSDIISNYFFQLSLKNSIIRIITDVSAILCLSLSFALFTFAFKLDNPLFQAMLLLPLITPGGAVSSIFLLIGKHTNESAAIRMLYLWKNSGLLTVLLLSARRSIPMVYYEAASLDGAKKHQLAIHITLPLLKGAILFCALLAVVINLQIFRETFLLYGAYPSENLYLSQHFMNNLFSKLKYTQLTAAGITFACTLVVPITIGWIIIHRRKSA